MIVEKEEKPNEIVKINLKLRKFKEEFNKIKGSNKVHLELGMYGTLLFIYNRTLWTPYEFITVGYNLKNGEFYSHNMKESWKNFFDEKIRHIFEQMPFKINVVWVNPR